MPGQIKIDDGSGNYTILTNAGSLGSDKTITIPNETATLATTTATNLGGLVLLDSSDNLNASSITFSDVLDKSIYNSFMLIVHGLRPTVANAALKLEALDSSDSVITGTYRRGYRYTQVNGTDHSSGTNNSYTDYWRLFNNTGNNGDTQNYTFRIFPEDDVFHNSHVEFTNLETSGGNTYQYEGLLLAPTGSATAFVGVKLSMTSGNLDLENVALWGLKK